MNTLRVSKKRLGSFLARVVKNNILIAPVKKDNVKFEQIKDAKDIYLDEQTYTPLKEFFFPQKETIFEFDKNGILPLKGKEDVEVFFGVRKCDLNAIRHQDMALNTDAHYHELRKKCILIGIHCKKAMHDHCFCGSLNLEDFFDLMFYEKGNDYIIEIGSDKGKEFAKKYKDFFKETDELISPNDKIIEGTDKLHKKDISGLFNHSDWQKGVDKCLSCAACTSLCPTCYCFEFCDDINLKDTKSGKRIRCWSSCQLKSFTRVAGDHVFREKRIDRFKHRIYHQLQYFKDKHGINLCVGCGRCIVHCPTKIDFVKIINEM